jgi:hypothetical protein
MSKQVGPLHGGVLLYVGLAGLRLQMRKTPLDRLVDVGRPTRLPSCSSCQGEVGFHQLCACLDLPATFWLLLTPLGSLQEVQSLPSRFDVRSSPIPFTSVCLSDIVIS